MKIITLLLAITFFPFSVFAGDLENQINKACLRHAVSLVARLKSDVIGEMTQEKSDQALIIATESCQAYFKKEFTDNPEAIAEEKKSNEKKTEDDKDWFTESILSGESAKKDGNKRLQRKY